MVQLMYTSQWPYRRSYYNSALQFLLKNCQARVEGGAERLPASNALTTPARGGADDAAGVHQLQLLELKLTDSLDA